MHAVDDDQIFSEHDVLFEETQRFTQWWLWAPILVGAAVVWIGAVIQLLLGNPIGTNPVLDSVMLILWITIGVFLPASFLLLKLRTIVRADGILIRFTPLHFRYRRYPFDEIEEITARTYRPLLEYGGWGIRLGPSGWAYNVRGNRGVQIKLKSGKRILIGTQRPDVFLAAVNQVRGKVDAD